LLVGARRFLEDFVGEVGREEEVVDAYIGLVRSGLGAVPRTKVGRRPAHG
jgi:predicted membrane GTPase involved in stress response